MHDTILTAAVLVGGLGTRLRSAYEGPKCMAPIAGRPFLEYVLRALHAGGISRVVLCVGYRADQVISWASQQSLPLEVLFSRETEPLGTGGALREAEPLLRDERHFLVLNGDSLLMMDLHALAAFHSGCGAKATLALARVPNADRYGRVQIDAAGSILGFTEKKPADDLPATGLQFVNGGSYVFRQDVFDLLPAGRPVSLEREVFPHLLGQGFYGFTETGFFIDIGIPSDFQRAQIELPKRFLL